MKCAFLGCEETENLELHHIVYPDGPTACFCPDHHLQLTVINSHKARKQRSGLSRKQRWYLYYNFIEGKLKKPRITRLDRMWAKGYSRRRDRWNEGWEWIDKDGNVV